MAGRPKARKRKIDINSMSREQLQRLEEELGKQLAKIYDEANTKANKLLNIYGLQAKLLHEVIPMGEKNTKNL